MRAKPFWFLAMASLTLATLTACSPSEPPQEANMAEVFEEQCALCHGSTGAGDTPSGGAWPATNLVDGTWKYGSGVADIEGVLRNGSPGTPMRSFATTLSAEEIAAMAKFVQSLSR